MEGVFSCFFRSKSWQNGDPSQIVPVNLSWIDVKEERRHAQKSLSQCWCEFEGFLAMDGVFNRKMIREMLNNLLIGIIGLIQVVLHLLTNLLQMGGCWDDLDKATVWGQDSFKLLIICWRKMSKRRSMLWSKRGRRARSPTNHLTFHSWSLLAASWIDSLDKSKA